MKTFFALLGVASILASGDAATSCAECGGSTCILNSAGSIIKGGATSHSVNFCNYDSSKNDSYALILGVSSIPTCDTSNATVPKVASLIATDMCTPEFCTVMVNFESALDWAIALQNNGASNTLTAQLKSGDKKEIVKIATFEAMAAPSMNSNTATISVCATGLKVSGSKFSTIDTCNTAKICRGSGTDTTCTKLLMNNAQIRNVTCSGEACTGIMTWSQSLPCDGSVGGATALVAGVMVASSTESNFIRVGNMAAPTFNISDVNGLMAGSSELVLLTDTFCASSDISLTVLLASSSDDDLTQTAIEVRSVNSTNNGTVIVELASPLSSDLVGDDTEVSLSQCSVSATGLFTVEKTSGDSASVSATGSKKHSKRGESIAGTPGTVSTQEANSSAGLSHSVIVGIVIAVVALIGFTFEYVYHKRRQLTPKPQEHAAASPT
ncbi:hypothetical protein PsorP6_000299 [Peronosclerospora sorghi]|uniref:Uncharacterized protein n=1 Tax=Peronosclerospora sorghi TaxID=230839 RepID=A0ACC0WWF7_9STRA|nr:hypothetical protein PsorP6_000299 [Peronosclerospora sorghi]